MAWGLVLIAVAGVIGWRRPRVDRTAVLSFVVAIGLGLAYTYKSLGG